MVKDNNVNIKLEVCKDTNSGKLTIMAHFDVNAPNIFIDKNEYIWMPTIEEKDLINEAFNLISLESTSTPQKTVEVKPASEAVIEEKPKPYSEVKPEPILPLEKENEPAIFEVTGEEESNGPTKEVEDEKYKDVAKEVEEKRYKDLIKEVKEEQYKEIEKEKNMDVKVHIKPSSEEVKPTVSDTEKEEDDKGIIVEADEAAIEAALKRRSQKDESIREVDEQTIIDKVLSQKKKGKWNKIR